MQYYTSGPGSDVTDRMDSQATCTPSCPCNSGGDAAGGGPTIQRHEQIDQANGPVAGGRGAKGGTFWAPPPSGKPGTHPMVGENAGGGGIGGGRTGWGDGGGA